MQIRPRQVIEYLEICWRRKHVIFLMTLAMLIATYAVIKRVPNLYESRALVIVTQSHVGGDDTLLQGTPFATVMQFLTSRGNLAALARRHKVYPQTKDFDDVIAKLQKEIKLNVKMRGYSPDGPESIDISYRYHDPVIAQKVIADLVKNFEEANVTIRQQATTEINSLTGKITEVEEGLKQIAPQRDLAILRSSQTVSQTAADTTALRTQRITVESGIEALSDREFALERQINDLRRQIAEQEQSIKSAPVPNGLAANPAYVGLLGRKADLTAQIKEFSAQYTDKNPKLISARGQLTEIERQLDRLEAASGSSAAATASPEGVELRRMKQELTRYETDLEVARRDLNRKTKALENLPTATSAATVGAPMGAEAMTALTASRSEYDRLMTRYNWLLGKQDALMKLAGIAGSGTPMFQVVDAPNVPELPVAPNRMLLYLIALCLAVAVSLVIVLAIEIPRMMLLNDERDVEYYLGAPVLGLIPETLTSEERSRHRRLRLTRSLIFLLFAAAMVPALIIVIDRIKVFQILGSK